MMRGDFPHASVAIDDCGAPLTVARPSQPNAVYGWASYFDNTSTDQTFVRPLQLE